MYTENIYVSIYKCIYLCLWYVSESIARKFVYSISDTLILLFKYYSYGSHYVFFPRWCLQGFSSYRICVTKRLFFVGADVYDSFSSAAAGTLLSYFCDSRDDTGVVTERTRFRANTFWFWKPALKESDNSVWSWTMWSRTCAGWHQQVLLHLKQT